MRCVAPGKGGSRTSSPEGPLGSSGSIGGFVCIAGAPQMGVADRRTPRAQNQGRNARPSPWELADGAYVILEKKWLFVDSRPLGPTALCSDTHFNDVDGKICIRGVLAMINDGHIGYVTATNRTDATGAIAAAAFCLVEGFINEANCSFQRDLGDQSRHWKARVADRNRAVDRLSIAHDGTLAYDFKQSRNGQIRLFRCYRIENGEELLAAPTDEEVPATHNAITAWN